MSLRATLHKKTFHFRFDARTSRGVMKDRTSWFIKISDPSNPDVFGVGECAPLTGLSPEFNDNYETKLNNFIESFNNASIQAPCPTLEEVWKLITSKIPSIASMSSVVFALETAMLDLANGGGRIIFKNSFIEGRQIPINGLIWMGGMDFQLQQIEIKIRDGFRCIKLKVGGLDFEKECDVLQYVRRKYFREDITIRLDANGAFRTDDVLYKLNELAKFNVHSIEQPLKKGSDFLPELCARSPIPVALDEELLGVADRSDLLKRVKPRYIILKPGLHGGMSGSAAWIGEAEKNNIGWWLTSALESNVGLNAIAQFAAQYPVEIPQGLGTGALYDDNFESPLEVIKGNLAQNSRENWVLEL
ncbi:MAG TPA: o-succinylbenzoate synthase [Cyclobacteriaceae bacterium]|nr:o-succinylbenzoate synthase [Cyclobacteriaceae bacterium]